MTSYRRIKRPGVTYFFTVYLQDRSQTQLTDHIAHLRFAYAKTIAELPVICDAMVLLPDHLHAIWTLPPQDADYSERWKRIKSRFSHGLALSSQVSQSKAGKRERGIWQRRFWEHTIRDEDDFIAHMAHCHDNPVKHGLVAAPRDWPYSSFNRKAHMYDGQSAHRPLHRLHRLPDVPVGSPRQHEARQFARKPGVPLRDRPLEQLALIAHEAFACLQCPVEIRL